MSDVKSIKVDNCGAKEDAIHFADGERVLCFHGPLIYEAKVLKTNQDLTPVEYYIHYAGWSKNWDEWVPEGRVLKYNDDNVKRQKELSVLYGGSKKDNKKGSTKAKKTENTGNESRASTPSKDGNSITHSNSTGGAGATGSTKHETSSTTTSNTSRSNRKSTQAASVAGGTRPITPNINNNDKKEDAATPTELTEDEVSTTAPVAPKKKRMSSSHSSATGNGHDSTNTLGVPTTTGTSTTLSADIPCVESEENFGAKLEVKIKIPDELKHYLTDDWYAIVREHKLLEVPAKVSVQKIVEDYLTHKKSAKSTNASKEVAINDVLDGVVEYFNVMLGSQLLYKFERTQYADIIQKHPEAPLSEMYGSFHLLRLFVKLGSMLSYSALDQQAIQTLLAHLHDFLKFLVKNSPMYFSMANFINVDPEYVRNAQ